jgi:hypothetical protein
MKCIQPVGLFAICVALACTEPVGPEFTQFVVTVEWTVARESGFLDARWQLIEYDTDDWISRGPVVAEGAIGPDGVFTARYQTQCTGTHLTGYRLEVFGRFQAHEGGSLPECSAWVPLRCTHGSNTSTIHGGLPLEACTPPVAPRVRVRKGGP